MFVTYLEESGFLCHHRTDIRIEVRKIFCNECDNLILDVEKHLTETTSPLLSAYLAKIYASWTGDLNVPCRIVLKDIPGIKPSVVTISYANLLNTIQLFGAMNQDFISCKNRNFDVAATLKAKILEKFMEHYMNMVDKIEYERESIEEVLKAILKQMQNSFDMEDCNIFEYYYKVICPYVKTFDSTTREETVDENSPGEFFLHLSRNATEIRNHFGKHCLLFDVIYVMIYCFACQTELDVIANLIFDLIARLCRGYFDENNNYQQTCRDMVRNNVSHDKNTQLYYLVKHLNGGDAADSFSREFCNRFAVLQQIIFTEFSKVVSTPSEIITKFAFSQSFPFILFPTSPNYYAFMCMMGFAASKLNEKTVTNFERGTCANARQIFKFIESFIEKIRLFENGQISETKGPDVSSPISRSDCPKLEYWTMDMFKLFIGTDDVIVKQLTLFLDLLTT